MRAFAFQVHSIMTIHDMRKHNRESSLGQRIQLLLKQGVNIESNFLLSEFCRLGDRIIVERKKTWQTNVHAL